MGIFPGLYRIMRLRPDYVQQRMVEITTQVCSIMGTVDCSFYISSFTVEESNSIPQIYGN